MRLLLLRTTSCFQRAFPFPRKLRCSRASLPGPSHCAFSAANVASSVPSSRGRPSRQFLLLIYQTRVPRYFFTNTTHCRPSQSWRGSHRFLDFWLLALPQSCFSCCFPLSLLAAQKSFPMATTLLKCSICPNQPTFSDTTHLLTHVSSKGHLSNLHRLQVRSVQESNAGRHLTAYNQWYQQHDLGRLLSERMLQRESKKATRRTRSTMSPNKVKKEVPMDTGVAAESQRLAVGPRLQQTSLRLARRSRTIVGSILQPGDDESDLDSSPVKQLTQVFLP